MSDRITGVADSPDYGLDELVQSGVTIHIERMSGNHFWIGIDHPDGRHIRVGLHAKGEIMAHVEEERHEPARPGLLGPRWLASAQIRFVDRAVVLRREGPYKTTALVPVLQQLWQQEETGLTQWRDVPVECEEGAVPHVEASPNE